jgi:hypothetical protein
MVAAASVAWAFQPPEGAEPLEAYHRFTLLLALLGLLVLGTFLLALIWFGIRYAQYLRARNTVHRGPSGQVGPSHWEPSPLKASTQQQNYPDALGEEFDEDEDPEDWRDDGGPSYDGPNDG